MGRKRFITSDMSTDEGLAYIAAENPMAALMWPWFLTGFDDWGRMEASPTKVKLSIFPAFPFGAEDVAKAEDAYVKFGLVHRYQMDGRVYLAIDPAKFYRYQTYIDQNKRSKDASSCPPPVDAPWLSADQADSSATARHSAPPSAIQLDTADSSATQALNVPSPSPSPSLSNKSNTRAHAREYEIPLDDLEAMEAATREDAAAAIQEHLGAMNGWIVERLLAYLEYGAEPSLIVWAVREAVESNARNFKYVARVIQNNLDKGIRTAAAAQAAKERFQARKVARARPDPNARTGPPPEAAPAGGTLEDQMRRQHEETLAWLKSQGWDSYDDYVAGKPPKVTAPVDSGRGRREASAGVHPERAGPS